MRSPASKRIPKCRNTSSEEMANLKLVLGISLKKQVRALDRSLKLIAGLRLAFGRSVLDWEWGRRASAKTNLTPKTMNQVKARECSKLKCPNPEETANRMIALAISFLKGIQATYTFALAGLLFVLPSNPSLPSLCVR